LPDTFYTVKTGKKVPAQMEAQLPSNYSTSGKFPLFVFLKGGDGGDAGIDSTGGTRYMIGDTDFISVSLPLFKAASGPNSTVGEVIGKDAQVNLPPAMLEMIKNMRSSGIISQQDYDVINSSYAVMLGKLFETIPNIDPDRSVLIGFSNGAHTIGVLLAGKSPFVLGHFHSFCMVEGGMAMAFDPKTTLTPELKNHRYLILFGDGGSDKTGMQAMMRPFVFPILQNFVLQATAYGLDCSLVTMQNTAHTFNQAYYPLVRQWARGGSAGAAVVK
jgi:predicted esterase